MQICDDAYPNSDLGEIGPCSDALPSDGVWVSFAALEGGLELAQLDTGKVAALTSTTTTL